MKLRTLTVAVLLTISCDRPNSSATDLRTAYDTVGGVQHIRNAGVPPTWSFALLTRIGAVDAGPEAFGRIRSVVADSEGRIYVADNMASEVRVFGPDGSYVLTIGRRGGGPGEFGDLYSLAWLGDELAAMDPSNARIGRFSRQGTWIDGIRHYPITGPGTFIRLHPLADQGFYAPVIAAGHSRLPFVRITPTGPADTIPAPTPPEGVRTYGVRCDRPDGGIQFISIPEAPATLFSYPPPGGQIAVAWSQEYRIARIGPNGDTVSVVHREHDPVPYPDSLWQVALEPYERMREQFPGSRCEPAAPERPASRAAIRDLLFDDTGRMWVEAATETGLVWEVFAQSGSLIARFAAPERATSVPAYVRGDKLYQVEVDEDGVQYVAVYRLERN
jgi:hypothetical protein